MIPWLTIGRLLIRRETIIVVAVLGLVAMCHQRDQALIREGEMRADSVLMAKSVSALRHEVSRLESAFRVDTVRLTEWRTRYDVRRDTLRLTDTVQVKEFVRVADSTVKACTRAVTTCARALAAKDSLLVSSDSLWARRLRSVTKEQTADKVRWGVAGVLLGAAAAWLQMQ